jgi:tetratricopeptide (TPR) repeat protein
MLSCTCKMKPSRAIFLLFTAFICAHISLSHANGQSPDADEAMLMLQRGDSLFKISKPVAALAMYRGAEERSFDPCLIALSRIGIARVHAQSNNDTQASSALNMASDGLVACSAEDRLNCTLQAADLWLDLQKEERATALLRRELKVQPNNILLLSRLAELSFIAGDWSQALESFTYCILKTETGVSMEQQANWLGYMVQIEIIQNQSLPDSLNGLFHSVLEQIPLADAQAHREQIHLLLSSEGKHLEALNWAQSILNVTDPFDVEHWCVAQLRIASSAHLAHRPLESLIGFHEAIKAARLSGNPSLLVEALRQKADFETVRENYADALAAMVEVDSLNTAMLAAFQNTKDRPVRGFTEQMLPEPDPFERAVINLSSSQNQPRQSGSWPWLAGIFAIGLIAMNRSHQAMKLTLKKERRRLIRLRSLVPTDRLPQPDGQQDSSDATEEEPLQSNSSLMPNGTLVFTGDDDPKAQSMHAFLSELDADIQHAVAWKIDESIHLNISPDVRVALRNLIRSFMELSNAQQSVELEVEQLDSHWKFSLSSDHTEASKALSGLFHGKDAVASSRWNELHAQLRKLAGRIQVERVSPIREKLTVILPVA